MFDNDLCFMNTVKYRFDDALYDDVLSCKRALSICW